MCWRELTALPINENWVFVETTSVGGRALDMNGWDISLPWRMRLRLRRIGVDVEGRSLAQGAFGFFRMASKLLLRLKLSAAEFTTMQIPAD